MKSKHEGAQTQEYWVSRGEPKVDESVSKEGLEELMTMLEAEYPGYEFFYKKRGNNEGI